MFESMERFPYRRAVFTMFVLSIVGPSTTETVSEFADAETLASMGDELSRFAMSPIVLVLFSYERLAQRRTLGGLRGQPARRQLARPDTRSQELASQYRAVMQKQFDTWRLTTSEQDVVRGLLKGLSFREIAQLQGRESKCAGRTPDYAAFRPWLRRRVSSTTNANLGHRRWSRT